MARPTEAVQRRRDAIFRALYACRSDVSPMKAAKLSYAITLERAQAYPDPLRPGRLVFEGLGLQAARSGSCKGEALKNRAKVTLRRFTRAKPYDRLTYDAAELAELFADASGVMGILLARYVESAEIYAAQLGHRGWPEAELRKLLSFASWSRRGLRNAPGPAERDADLARCVAAIRRARGTTT